MVKSRASCAAADAGVADHDDAALAGGTLSDTELKERMQALLGDEIYNGLLVYFPNWQQITRITRTAFDQDALAYSRYASVHLRYAF